MELVREVEQEYQPQMLQALQQPVDTVAESLLGRLPAQQADGVLPVVPSVLAELIQDYLLGLSALLR
jgi:hypothetical protein